MSAELRQAYRNAAEVFYRSGAFAGAGFPNGDIPRSWRYFLEINSACNLSCPSCTKGNKAGYEHQNGIMDWDLMERILDKIVNENNTAIVFLYGNSEPFLHPKLPEVIAAVKARGLRCEMSTNLNFVRRLDEVIAAGPAFSIISLSGFTQEIYVRGHHGGDIDKVKANMLLLSEANKRATTPAPFSVCYHQYNDNGHEIEPMEAYAKSLGIGFFSTPARVISMENALQHLRELETARTGQPVLYAVPNPAQDLNQMLPPVTAEFKATVARMEFKPEGAREKYKDIPVDPHCPVGEMFTFIRHDGKTEMCACVADRRLTLGNFLETSQDQLSAQRFDHPICQMCQHYKMSYYFHMVKSD